MFQYRCHIVMLSTIMLIFYILTRLSLVIISIITISSFVVLWGIQIRLYNYESRIYCSCVLIGFKRVYEQKLWNLNICNIKEKYHNVSYELSSQIRSLLSSIDLMNFNKWIWNYWTHLNNSINYDKFFINMLQAY